MRLSELSGKEIVDLQRAERLGVLGHADLEINEQDGKVLALIIPTAKWSGLKRNQQDIRISWDQIKKVGKDMIIFDLER
ncbi:YlmC/YmxH family sporulation protein [Bacillus sp. 165]|uniref:YlmC/YmxH family sporulation protein n=1 Tax=Bacillus sp. 165 TaxID=1529117 RepID=UPI001ADBB55D|nr:YlmC/YmxH family sporulation protein [Bacillus sp. 165]MBO9128870.1 YlmC/YmxH family sporulation protein [Bacillus sp. 165]